MLMNGVMPIPPAMSIPARTGSLCNPADVANQAPCFGHRCRFLLSLAEQLEVGPQGGAEKAHVSDNDLGGVEHLDPSTRARPLEFSRSAIDAATVELRLPPGCALYITA